MQEGITVFAPSNAAFEEAFPDGKLERLSPEDLANLVARHVILGKVKSEALARDRVSKTKQTKSKIRSNFVT